MMSYMLSILVIMGIYMLLALALDLQYGFTGLINFGLAGFFGIGAYASALLTMKAGWSPLLSFPAAMLAAALLAWPLGRVALRLRDDYLAIVTLGFSEIVRLVLVQEQWLTNGVQGIPGVPRLGAGWGDARFSDALLLALLALSIAAAVAVLRRVTHSPYGRTIQAVRDDETAVRVLGKEPARFKTQVLMLGAALSGLAGAYFAHYMTYIVPDQFVPLITFYVWMAIIMGGVARLSGSVAGAVLLVLFLEGVRFTRGIIPGVSDADMGSVQLGVVGLVLILFMRWRPQGLFGARGAR
ncbi:branched-chain amino acid ABC transporter permease [Bordetella genomosp. 11]|uniref:Branched-chain amino acid ABC transporter permease n=1 Tax=Bordetella genomosp. 11 TaxID=1416808 RepID=A0A261URH2_9BORD|nr:branched-chain amino acid ABC transporter permease [Bordetella genomosp. 11]OZI64498.1 branched-chain amino acid ABC transporter permease [Bordetella genomosp. 11]